MRCTVTHVATGTRNVIPSDVLDMLAQHATAVWWSGTGGAALGVEAGGHEYTVAFDADRDADRASCAAQRAAWDLYNAVTDRLALDAPRPIRGVRLGA